MVDPSPFQIPASLQIGRSTVTDDQALEALDAERRKYTTSDKALMQGLCYHLVETGVYPAVSKIGLPALKMVENWGVYWHQFKGVLNCPSCDADLRDHEHGPPGKRELGFIWQDRLHHFDCPDCGHSFGHAD